jgi:tRNA (guanine-N7-)-methyltransferase
VGKDKLKRFREIDGYNHVFQPGFKEVYQKDFRLKGKWRSEYFNNSNPIVLELGCGRGEYTVGLAERNPEVNFIGIDIKGARLWRGAKTAHEKNMKNVAFVRSTIDIIDSFFAEEEINEIWLTFSDPQPKRVKKRLSSTKFLNKYKNFLKSDGIIHIKTDSRLLFEYSYALANENNFFITFMSRDVYNEEKLPEPVAGIQTFYEKQFLDKGCKIHYLEYKIHNKHPFIEPEEFNNTEAIKYK